MNDLHARGARFTEVEYERMLAAAASRGAAAGPKPLSPEQVLRGIREIVDGVVVSCGAPNLEVPDGDGERAGSLVLRREHDSLPGEQWEATNERIEVTPHGRTGLTHLDALEHFYWRGESYGGARVDRVKAGQEPVHDVLALPPAFVTRGVLIDLEHAARSGEVEPGVPCTPDQLRAILDRAGVVIESGDVLLVRMSRSPSDGSRSGGLSIACADWLGALLPSLVISDSGFDSQPSEVDGVLMPWHVLLLTALGAPLIDLADLERVSAECRSRGRHTFAVSVAPIGIQGSTSSPVNPLVVF